VPIGVLLVLALHAWPADNGAAEDLRSLLDAKYRAWRQHLRARASLHPERGDPRLYYFDNQAFRQIVELGVPAVPYLVEKVQHDDLVGYALYKITGFRWHTSKWPAKEGILWVVDEFPDVQQLGGPPDAKALWLRWWQQRGKRTPVWFDQRYREWQRLKREGNQDEAKQQYELIVELGLEALPLMVDTMKKGSSDLVPALSRLTNGAVKEDANPAECVQWWNDNKDKWTLPPPESKEESDTKSQRTAR